MSALRRPAASRQRGSYTATVRAADGVLFAVSTSTPRALAARVVEFIRARCDDVLWSSDAAEVQALIADGQLEAAIATYFLRVGERWDEERLELGGARMPTSWAFVSSHAPQPGSEPIGDAEGDADVVPGLRITAAGEGLELRDVVPSLDAEADRPEADVAT